MRQHSVWKVIDGIQFFGLHRRERLVDIYRAALARFHYPLGMQQVGLQFHLVETLHESLPVPAAFLERRKDHGVAVILWGFFTEISGL